MDKLVEIHDNCLEYENDIQDSADMLGERRNKAYHSGEKESFKEIIPVLNSIIQDAELYKEYLIDLEDEEENVRRVQLHTPAIRYL